MNRTTEKTTLLGVALMIGMGMSASSFAVDAGAPGRAVQGSNPSAPSTQTAPTQTAPSGNSNSNTNGANTNNYNTNTNSSGSVGNGSINSNPNSNPNNNSGTSGSGVTGTTNGAEPTGTLEEQRRASGEAMERERTGE